MHTPISKNKIEKFVVEYLNLNIITILYSNPVLVTITLCCVIALLLAEEFCWVHAVMLGFGSVPRPKSAEIN